MRARIARELDESALDDVLRALDEAPRSSRSVVDALRGIEIGERIARRARIGPDTCLYRALARYASLRRSGHEPRFVMGVALHDAADGHAWIEIDDRPVLEPRLPSYTRTLEHPPRPRA